MSVSGKKRNGYHYLINNEKSVPSLVLSKISQGTKFYAQINSCIACSVLKDEKEVEAGIHTGSLSRGRVLPKELIGEDYTPKERQTSIGKTVAELSVDIKQTTDRKNRDEPSYVVWEAEKSNQKITFTTGYPGDILVLDATPLAEDEMYVQKRYNLDGSLNEEGGKEEESISDSKCYENYDENKVHGTWIAVSGSFLAAESTVSTSIYHTEDKKVINFSETKDNFQKFSGKGKVFLEVRGGVEAIPLYPEQVLELDGHKVRVLGEAVDVFPGSLIAFSEGVKLEMKSAGDKKLRNEENNDYVIQLTAGKKGGYVFISTSHPKNMFEVLKEYIEESTKKMIETMVPKMVEKTLSDMGLI